MTTTIVNEVASRRPNTAKSPKPTKRPRIAFFGIFGIQNLGNECTLQAILHNARERQPDAEIYSISYDPDDTARRHNVRAVAVSQQNLKGGVRRRGVLAKLVRMLLRRIPGELQDWRSAIRTLRGTDLVVMTGTGMLTDYSTNAFGFPYAVFQWTVAARLAGCKVRFVGVGVGPIYGRLSRLFIRCALSLADYRSFRDYFSKNRIAKTCFDSGRDPVFPDLAFSLPETIFPHHRERRSPTLQVGLGVMDHQDIHLSTPDQHRAEYSTYLEKMCDFVAWLVEHGYGVRILQGDARHDVGTRAELKARLEQRGIRYEQAGIIDEDTATVEDLLRQLAAVDIIVSPRFHNLLLGMMLNIPVVSISYDPKNDSLLEGVGLGKYRQALADLDVQKLIEQFTDLEAKSQSVKPMISDKASEYRSLLEKQYDLIFGDL
jgi:polysaccharide pyruvyl transferase WcaK-like protein